MILVYKYGTGAGVRLPEEAREQLSLAHRMRNELIAAQLYRDEAIRLILGTETAVADAQEALTAATLQCEEWAATIRRERSTDRSVAARRESAAALKTARETRRGCKDTLKQARAQVRDRLKPWLDEVDADLRTNTVTIRQDYSARGLYWGIYNAVIDDHMAAMKRIYAERKAGKPAELRFRRWTGDGTLTVQLQRQAADPVRSPASIAGDTGKWRNVLRLPGIDGDPADATRTPRAQRRAAARGHMMRWSIGGGNAFELPVTVHRPIPPDADITGAQLSMRTVAGKPKISIAVTCKLPDPEPATGPTVALHMGWRSRGDGSVRVMTWACADPVDVPDRLTHLLIPYDSGRRGEVILPAGWLSYAAYPGVLRSIRDKEQTPVQEALAGWLDEHPQPPLRDGDAPLTGAAVRRWRSPARLAALALRWRDTRLGRGAAVAADLEAWRVHDKHLWTWEASQRRRAVRRRDDGYAQVAAWLARTAGALVVDDTDLRQVRRRPDETDTDPVLPGSVQQDARERAVYASPGRLRQLARTTAVRSGLRVVEVEAVHLSRTCPACGAVGGADPRYAAAVTVTCPSCDIPYDQDYSAATLMLARERSGGASTPG